MSERIGTGAFRRIARSLAADAVRGFHGAPSFARRGVAPFEAVPLTLRDAIDGLDRWTVPALPPGVSRLVRGAAEACAEEAGDRVWLVRHADGAFDAMSPAAFAALGADGGSFVPKGDPMDGHAAVP